jgi:hypothetical protein
MLILENNKPRLSCPKRPRETVAHLYDLPSRLSLALMNLQRWKGRSCRTMLGSFTHAYRTGAGRRLVSFGEARQRYGGHRGRCRPIPTSTGRIDTLNYHHCCPNILNWDWHSRFFA